MHLMVESEYLLISKSLELPNDKSYNLSNFWLGSF